MARLAVMVGLALVLGACGDDPVPYYGSGGAGGGTTTGDGCGVNSVRSGDTCACRSGYDWCAPGDPNDFDCCPVGGGGGGGGGTGGGGGGGGDGDGEIIVNWDGAELATHQQVEAYLMGLGIHEAIAQAFTQALVLPEDLLLVAGECGMANAFYTRMQDNTALVAMCYELWGVIAETFATEFDGDQAAAMTLDTWLYVLFHELGHAFIDILDIPIVSSEEDAVDALSTVLLIAAERPDAAVNAAVFWMLADDNETVPEELADEHSLNTQRFYNILCLVYGSNPAEYASFETAFPEMAARLPRCADEFRSASEGWDRLLAPHER